MIVLSVHFCGERYYYMCQTILIAYRLPSVLFVLMGLMIFDIGNDVFCDQVLTVRAAGSSREHEEARHASTRAADLPAGCVDDGNTDYPGAINCIVDPKKFDCNLVADKAPCTYEDAKRPNDY